MPYMMHLVPSLCDMCVTCCQGESVTNSAHDLVFGPSLACQQGFPPHVSSDCHAIKSAHVLHMHTPCQLMLPCMLGWQASISLVFQIGIRVLNDMALLTHQVSHAQADWCITTTQPHVVTLQKLSSNNQVQGSDPTPPLGV